jgi:hypothetical protein
MKRSHCVLNVSHSGSASKRGLNFHLGKNKMAVLCIGSWVGQSTDATEYPIHWWTLPAKNCMAWFHNLQLAGFRQAWFVASPVCMPGAK